MTDDKVTALYRYLERKNSTPNMLEKKPVVNKRWVDDDNPVLDRRRNTKSELILQKNKHRSLDYYICKAEDESVTDSQEIVQSSFQHFKENIEAVAIALDVPIQAIEDILNAEDIAFTPEVLKKCGRLYRNRVTNSDAVTGLLNKAAFILKANKLIKQDQPFCIMFIDLDKFKPVNDTYGHAMGDRLLQAVGSRIRENVPQNALIARLGGDEFGVAMPIERNETSAVAFSKTVESSLHLPFHSLHAEKAIQIGASLGLTFFPQNGKNIDELLDKADSLMYESKNSFDKPPTLTDYLYYYGLMIGPVVFFIVWITLSFIRTGA